MLMLAKLMESPKVLKLLPYGRIHATRSDTMTSHGRLMLTVLGGLAEFERDLIRARTGEGRQRAKDRGVKLGRKPKLTPHQRREALVRREAGEPLAEIARSFGVDHSTISRMINTQQTAMPTR